ncbi:MAG: ribosome maturation factor RimP [Thermoanaerobaculaceae bacterium]|jgi:ribosome maturation factor RimP
MARLSEDLVARLERLAVSEGLELLAVEVGGTARSPVVRLVLDRQKGGVSLTDCESVSRQSSALLDTYDPFPGAFTLEVSSPGIERKLYKDNDFSRFAGRAVRVRMRPTWPAPRVIEGVLGGRADGVIRVCDRAGATHELPEPEVFETRLAPHLEEEDKKKPKHRGRT